MPYGMPVAYNTNPMPMTYTGNPGYYYPTY
jgi:hypothetical protein